MKAKSEFQAGHVDPSIKLATSMGFWRVRGESSVYIHFCCYYFLHVWIETSQMGPVQLLGLYALACIKTGFFPLLTCTNITFYVYFMHVIVLLCKRQPPGLYPLATLLFLKKLPLSYECDHLHIF